MSPPSSKDELYEDQHVHQVYEQIAPHFSSTRYKPWPIVESFLRGLAPGAIGLDIGCGNGKYLGVNQDIFIIASDRSQSLVNIARSHAQHTAVVADNLNLPHPDSTFDFAISIAVVHHLSTPARRVKAIECILNTLKVTDDDPSTDARALIYVWALEQKSSRRGWDKGDEQDVMVPWIMKQKTKNDPDEKDKVFQRYYHLYQSGELDNDIISAGGRVLNAGFEKDNWWAIATRKTPS